MQNILQNRKIGGEKNPFLTRKVLSMANKRVGVFRYNAPKATQTYLSGAVPDINMFSWNLYTPIGMHVSHLLLTNAVHTYMAKKNKEMKEKERSHYGWKEKGPVETYSI